MGLDRCISRSRVLALFWVEFLESGLEIGILGMKYCSLDFVC